VNRDLLHLVLPATLAVTTFAFATACTGGSDSDSSTRSNGGERELSAWTNEKRTSRVRLTVEGTVTSRVTAAKALHSGTAVIR